MKQYQVAVVVDSLRKDSFNRKLANAIVKLAPPDFSFHQVQIGDLPLYNQDDDSSPAESVKRSKRGAMAGGWCCAGSMRRIPRTGRRRMPGMPP